MCVRVCVCSCVYVCSCIHAYVHECAFLCAYVNAGVAYTVYNVATHQPTYALAQSPAMSAARHTTGAVCRRQAAGAGAILL